MEENDSKAFEIIFTVIVSVVVIGGIIAVVMWISYLTDKYDKSATLSGVVESIQVKSASDGWGNIENNDVIQIEGKQYEVISQLHDVLQVGDKVQIELNYDGMVDSIQK